MKISDFYTLALRQYLGKTRYPIDENTLPRVLREELKT